MVPRQRTGDDLPRAEPPPLVLNSKLTEGGTAMRRRIVAFTVAALLTGAAGVSAQIYAPQSVERYFRLEWEATRGRKRSEEHTSELQSRLHLVCRLLLEKKKDYDTRRESKSRNSTQSGVTRQAW